MRYILLCIFTLQTLLAMDVSYSRGEMLFFQKSCSSCHGPDAEGSTTYPKLANKNAAYLKKRLFYYKKGEVNSVSQEMMAQFVQKLTLQNIDDLVEFLSKHKSEKTEKISDDILGGVGS